MATVVRGDRPAVLEEFLERRRALGQDLFDEVWQGDYHVAPAPDSWHSEVDQSLAEVLGPLARAAGLVSRGPFNLGTPDDFRVPDRGCHRPGARRVWFDTAALVVEIVSPDDQTWAKFEFYAAHEVDEICVADPRTRTVQWFLRRGDRYEPTDRSELLDVVVGALAERIDWPQ